MRPYKYKAGMNKISESLLNKGFIIKNRQNIFIGEYFTLIFTYSDWSFSAKMYVIDSVTLEHLETYIYTFRGYVKFYKKVEKQLKKIYERYNPKF